MKRCGRPVGSSKCGLPLKPKDSLGIYGNHWPHRYIENNIKDRVIHEWRLRKYGYTTWKEFAFALFGKAL